MSFNTTSLPDLITRTTNDLITRLQLATDVASRAFVRILAKAWSNAVNDLQGHIGWVPKQYFVSQCDNDMLPQHGVELGMSPLPPTFAIGPVTFTGEPGSPIPAGTPMQRGDTFQYQLLADATIGLGGTVDAIVQALAEGADGNAPAGTVLTLAWAVDGVSLRATVATGGIADGFDVESPDAFRARMLARKRNPPQGGAEADYEQWALSVPGVTRVWIRPKWMGPGTVGVLFVMDDQVGSIVPGPDSVAAVQAYIDQPTIRPVTADVYVVAADVFLLNLSIHLVPDTSAGRTAAEAELVDLLNREGEPGVCPPLGELQKSASNAAGVSYGVITSPLVDPAPAANQVPQLGVITWV